MIINNKSIRIDKEMAVNIGLKESIIYKELKKESNKQNEVYNISKVKDKLNFMSRSTFNRKLNELIKKDFIKKEKLQPKERKQYIVDNKNVDDTGIGHKFCDWCNTKTLSLNEHHYPIPKNKGGEDTVFICPNCHYEFHHLKEKIIII